MGWSIQDLGAIGEFVGSIFVAVTLVYLVVQVRQNSQSIKSQSRYQVLEALAADLTASSNSEYFALRNRISGGDASSDDVVQWNLTLAVFLSHMEILFHELSDESLPEEFRSPLRVRIAALLRLPQGAQVWESSQQLFTQSFREFVDGVAKDNVDEIVADGFLGSDKLVRSK